MTLPNEITTAQGHATAATVHLKVLATTDLHAHLLPFDYFTNARDSSVGLAQLAGIIAAARATSENVVLLDNGDTLQGAPLADAAVAEIVPAGRPHPMIVAMNALKYDAATLGNHDFDFGLTHLRASLKGAAFPVVSANSDLHTGEAFLPPRCVLTREVTDNAGSKHSLRIGITGAVPPQVAMWNKPHLQGVMTFRDMVPALRTQVAALRADGVDIVLVLAHSGYGSDTAQPGAENVALQVAGIPGVDGVIAGHTHKVRADAAEVGIHPRAPIVQPGAFGAYLGCLDFEMTQQEAGGRWQIRQTRARNLAAAEQPAQDAPGLRRSFADYPKLRDDIAREHMATRRFVARPLGKSAVPLETYFSAIAPCAATQVIADAQWAAARPLIAMDQALQGLPVLSAVAPFKAGGRSGPGSYTDVPAGALRLRHAADLYLYPNILSVLRMKGQGVADWLERSASLFHQIIPGSDLAPQPLIDHDFAPYNFDRLAGLRYRIDVTRPARTNAEGDQIRDTPGRIRNLTLADGTPLRPEDEVLVVTNSYRAAGGGHMTSAQEADEVIVAKASVRDAVARHMTEADGPLCPKVEPTFHLYATGDTEVVVETGPGALHHRARAAALGMTAMDTPQSGAGFQPFLMRI